MKVRNINVGVLGHVDAGKTSLCMALSSTASTAAFDKNPQSKERGITLDLGFSAMQVDDHLQFTFVDCPGHASLIRTVIGGAQIINFMLLVVDVTKGLQAQTLECIVIARIICPKVLIVLNKTDKLEDSRREAVVQRMAEKFRKTFAEKGLEILNVVPISATTENGNIITLKDAMLEAVRNCSADADDDPAEPLLFSIDHCFTIRGKGTICTGTVLQGVLRVGDNVEIPQLTCQRTVKSIEMFRKPLEKATRGDRLGVCITQFDSKLLERGLLCSPGAVPFCHCAVIELKRVGLFKGSIRSKMKFHVSVGHATVLATVTLFRGVTNEGVDSFSASGGVYEYVEEITEEDKQKGNYFVILEFEKPILWTPNCLVICSKLDMEANHHTSCRLAFYGTILAGCSTANYRETFLSTIKLYRNKCKEGTIQRVANEREIIVEDFFAKLGNRDAFIGMKVELSTGQKGRIESTFGKTSKVKISLEKELSDEEIRNSREIKVSLRFKKLLFSNNKIIFQ